MGCRVGGIGLTGGPFGLFHPCSCRQRRSGNSISGIERRACAGNSGKGRRAGSLGGRPDRDRTAQDVLRAVSAVAKPGVLPYAVSAICRGNPEATGSVVTTAIQLQPEDVSIFAKAALCAAPGQVEQIVFSACKAAPASCAEVAVAASRQLPAANNLILAGLARARPEMELYLEEAQIQAGTSDFEAVLKQAVQLYNEALKAPAK